LLGKISILPRLLIIFSSFHDNMEGIVSYNGNTSEPFRIKRGVEQGCGLASTLFGIFFSLLLKFAFRDSSEGNHLHVTETKFCKIFISRT
jgi:hypothetical protein